MDGKGGKAARKVLPMGAGIFQTQAEKRISKIISPQAANKLALLGKELQSVAVEVMLTLIIQGFSCQADFKQCFPARKDIEHWSDLLMPTVCKHHTSSKR